MTTKERLEQFYSYVSESEEGDFKLKLNTQNKVYNEWEMWREQGDRITDSMEMTVTGNLHIYKYFIMTPGERFEAESDFFIVKASDDNYMYRLFNAWHEVNPFEDAQ